VASFADGVPSTAARDVSLALVAGEASGDMLAARLLAGLRPHLPDARFHGIGGPRMIEQGMVSDVPMDLLTVRGLFEVIPRYRELKGIQSRLRDRLIAERPAAFIGADYPGFNLGLEEQLRTSSGRRSGPGAVAASRRSSAPCRTCSSSSRSKKRSTALPACP
jgi:lipid-A-disaccharide synthase